MAKSRKSAAENAGMDVPRCSHCGGEMVLTRIEPDQPGHDRRTFECKDCGHLETKTVRFRELTENESAAARRRRPATVHPHPLHH